MNQKNIVELSNIFQELELALLQNDGPLSLPDEAIRAVIYIFSTIMMDKMWELQDKEKMVLEDRLNMSKKMGETLRELIKTYTDIDTLTLF